MIKNVLTTKGTVKTLEGMDFQPIKVLDTLGYNYTEEDACEGIEWAEHRYTGVNPDNKEDIAVVTVGERDAEQYIYLENEDGEDWRFSICIEDNIITGVYKINTPTEALEELQTMATGCKYEDYVDYEELDDNDEVIDWDDVCASYDLELHGTSEVISGDSRCCYFGGGEDDNVVVLYINTADAPEVKLCVSEDGEIYEIY